MEKSIVIQERTTLSYLIHTPADILSFTEDDFVSKTGVNFFKALDVLHEKQIPFTDRNIAIEAMKYDSNIDESAVESVRGEPCDNLTADYLRESLRVSKVQYDLQGLLEKEMLTEVSRKDFDLAKVQDLRDQIEHKLSHLESEKMTVYTGKSMLEEYEKRIIPRLSGNSFYDTGDAWLNQHLLEGFAPGKITTIFAASGLGKSSYALHLVNQQVNKQVPAIYFSLEMDLVSTMDRMIAQRHRIPIKQLLPSADDDGILEPFLQKEKRKFDKVNYFRFVETPGLSLFDIKKAIQRAKREMGVDYLIVTIDLLTMVKEFNQSNNKANDYEHAMNLQHEIAKSENVHFVNVVQSRRPNDKVAVNELDDLEKFRPSIEMIKNSGAIEERSRVILSVFRQKHYAEKYFPDSPELEILDDIMEIQVLKQNLGHTGSRIPYLFIPESSNLYKYEEGEE